MKLGGLISEPFECLLTYKTPLGARDVLVTYKTPGSYTRVIRPPRGLISEMGGLIGENIFCEGSYKRTHFPVRGLISEHIFCEGSYK